MKYAALLLAAVILVGSAFTQNAFAHTFSGDESASFLATVQEIKVHLQLVQDNLESNATYAQEHAEHAASHIDEHLIEEISERNERLGRDLPASLTALSESLSNASAQQVSQQIVDINNLLAETVSVRVEDRQLENVTVHALVMANLGDSVLEAYGGAYGVKSENDTHDDHSSHGEENMMDTTENMTHQRMESNASEMSNTSEIVSEVHYQSAQALAASMQEYYNTELKPLASANDTTTTTAVADLEAGLADLIQSIENRAPLADVEVLVHTQVHGNLQKAYNLQVIPEFPMPLLMAVSAIAGTIALTRLRRRR